MNVRWVDSRSYQDTLYILRGSWERARSGLKDDLWTSAFGFSFLVLHFGVVLVHSMLIS